MELRNVAISVVIFGVLISLVVFIHNGFQNLYGTSDDYTVGGKNIAVALNDLSLIRQLNRTISEPTDLDIPSGSFFDIVGSLAAAGIGTLKVIASILILPVEIFGIITGFYYIPPVFVSALITIIILIVGFILLSKYIGSDV